MQSRTTSASIAKKKTPPPAAAPAMVPAGRCGLCRSGRMAGDGDDELAIVIVVCICTGAETSTVEV